jgi:hypothetical protein
LKSEMKEYRGMRKARVKTIIQKGPRVYANHSNSGLIWRLSRIGPINPANFGHNSVIPTTL